MVTALSLYQMMTPQPCLGVGSVFKLVVHTGQEVERQPLFRTDVGHVLTDFTMRRSSQYPR